MAKAYTPGLRVSARCIYRTRRALPTAGNVQVALGDRVQGATVIAFTHLDGDITPMKVASLLACPPKDLPALMLKKVGESVTAGEVIARSKGVFGMMKTEVKATGTGTIESVSDSSGMVFARRSATD